ncbi:hypothetical protein KK083_20795 [Fulvivirgaceae bacterium PWU4]|uniref:Uncharacterized protein n=1 Tax=Chryseosolibacter histidini TaxID=2782349 RepID=A0AAP2DQG4_9BACT|nr:hypothetical protein [Chryseosolibacter histidini]MBT1699347.1 hypothetical protein [Chryseosolibacter histidini]
MPQENRPFTLKPENLQKIFNALNDANESLKPYLISLTQAERQALPKMSEGTLPFVQMALEYARKNPGLVPVYIDVNELKTDLQTVEGLLRIFKPVEELYHNLNDTITLSGSEAFMASLAFYNSVKHATKINIPGTKVISEDLKMCFSKQEQKSA